MSYHRVYNVGDVVMHSAGRETDISRVLNAFASSGALSQSGSSANYCRIGVACIEEGTLATGTPVQLTGEFIKSHENQSCGDYLFFIKKASDNSKPFGILNQSLIQYECGTAVFLGIVPATLTRKSDKHNYAVLNQSGQLESAAAGPAAILWINGTDALICLGVGAGAAAAYDGPFAVTAVAGKLSVSKGWVLRNGETAEVPVTTVDAASGILCVCTTLKDGKWTAPVYKFCAPAPDAYPVAEIKTTPPVAPETTAKITIRQFPVTVAVINLVKPCPLAEV